LRLCWGASEVGGKWRTRLLLAGLTTGMLAGTAAAQTAYADGQGSPNSIVLAIPVTAFYASEGAPDHYVRFAFCKGDHLLDEALARIEGWLAGCGAARRAAAG
jgi:hypothetical protein